ncbi:MAG: restriction endonuclease [Candidatus Cloacimonas acidaminovorans]|nr:restriction endonuclease [Candidatus Cloacimonas acidaminovorans]
MHIMEYNQFTKILNENIFERSKPVLLDKISKNPKRFIGLFRPTRAKAKVMQNLLQSHEIKFGEAFEYIIEEYFHIIGFKILDHNLQGKKGNVLSIDQCFWMNEEIYFIEQKIRDDHDSTKKREQIRNFEDKLYSLIEKYPDNKLNGIFYFIDPEFKKNKNFYLDEIDKIKNDYGIKSLHLFYGSELFEFIGRSDIWDEIIRYLEKWKKEIPELPELNFDIEPKQSYEEIKDLNPSIYRSLFSNQAVVKEIFPILFPEKLTLKYLKDYFHSQESEIYQNLYKSLSDIINDLIYIP